ncbi:uncharacterized protein LOC131146042 isoform X2 [Malania oleifera]|uniref:uncharacterized protein LOC131146042 isoform X2 n=1 Tax=Malania oleifera TaxID=397392 RepID=UPI0025ADEA28|nr:uncharacterized protein LOC131146042 isoform X2 [Malania oleifera]
MLCSISSSKSASNWLDRLRSSRGFPTGGDQDLDHFLTPHDLTLSGSSNTNASAPTAANIDRKSDSGSSPSDQPKPALHRTGTAESSCDNGEEDWFGIMSNVLAELFVMGDSDGISKSCAKKSSRKQANPRICALSKSSSVDEKSSYGVRGEESVSATVPSSGDNSLTEMKRAKRDNVDCVNVQEEKCYGDLKAFSRTEVTVIDTSCASWKFEKLLFRRKNVWKVREKKCKAKNVGEGKKRKVSSSDENVGGEKKKPRITILPFGSLKEANRGEHIVQLHEKENPQNGKREVSHKTADIVSEAPKRRSPKKLGKACSSVVLLKGVPMGKKNVANIPKSRLNANNTQKQCKA